FNIQLDQNKLSLGPGADFTERLDLHFNNCVVWQIWAEAALVCFPAVKAGSAPGASQANRSNIGSDPVQVQILRKYLQIGRDRLADNDSSLWPSCTGSKCKQSSISSTIDNEFRWADTIKMVTVPYRQL